jgi:hypothetical protein
LDERLIGRPDETSRNRKEGGGMNTIGFSAAASRAEVKDLEHPTKSYSLVVHEKGLSRLDDNGEAPVSWGLCIWADDNSFGVSIHPKPSAAVVGLAEMLAANEALRTMLADAVRFGHLLAATRDEEQ